MVKAKVKGKAVLSESEQVKEDMANNAIVDATTAESESDPEELEAEEPVLVSVGEEEDGDNNSAGKEKEEDDNNSGGDEKEDGDNNSGGEEKEDDDNPGGKEKDDDNNKSGGKEKDVDNHKEEVKNEEKVEKTLTKKDNKPRKRNKKKKALGGAAADASKEGGKPETSNKNGKKAESMGMIFMCNSKTKKDCYNYKVLGLPAGKKEIVAKIYKGMRLFLYDFDLKLMYGIYKAAGPGGYNIEPKAFKSAFPSQVRFTVLEDCLPLPEEKFKKVIKENYSGRNKFDTQLNSEQVKNLCKLFLSNKGKPNRGGNPPPIRAELRSRFTDRGRNRPDRARGPASLDDRRIPKRPRIYEREPYQSGGAPPISKRPRIYEREAYQSPPVAPPPQYSRLPPPLPPSYERPLEVDYYRRDEQLEQRIRLLEMELKRRDETEYRDPYAAYKEREPPAYHIPREPPVPPTYHAPSYDPLYSASLAPGYAPPPLAPTSSSYYRL